MKRKFINYVCYPLLFSLIFISCMNEMEVIENESSSEINNELFFLPDPIKALINYDKKSMSVNDIYKIEKALEQIYRIPQMKDVLHSLIDDGIKINMWIATPGSEMKTEAEYKLGNPPEIGFLRSDCITMENLVHELLHHYAYAYYTDYHNGSLPTCEEYEVRVLTDLLMRRQYGDNPFKYQGMRVEEKEFYLSYKQWINDLVNTFNYDVATFEKGFKMYGTICVMNFKISDKPYTPKLKAEELNYYSLRLMETFWFNYRK